MFKNLLEYQKLDGKILALKRDVQNNAAKQTLNKVVALVKDSQNKLLELETKAKSSIQEYEKYKSDYEKVFAELAKLNKQDASNLSEEMLNENLEKANQLVAILGTLERGLSSQAENINTIIKNFEVCRNNIVTYRQKYKESKAKCDEIEANVKPSIEEIKRQIIQA